MPSKLDPRTTCRYASWGITWIKDGGEFDGNYRPDGTTDYRSSEGYWQIDSQVICEKFESADQQFNKRCGFFFCNNPKKCSYYADPKKVKSKIENKPSAKNTATPPQKRIIFHNKTKGFTSEELERIHNSELEDLELERGVF